ncbi:MAG: glycosyltransferase family 2 protein, partial [Selenomonas sp.]|nr:glycosyltransferase family 2 protein [Selenomonas sp.]
MITPIVSVIVPVYNGEKYIRDCLQSLLAQTLQNFEVIVVDDASTDRSGEICAAMAETDSRIRIVQLQENSGAGMARNR